MSFFKGRSSKFLHFYAVCSIMSRQEIFLYFTSVWLRFVFIRFYKASGFSNIFGYYCEHCLLCGEDFLCVPCYIVSGVCFTHCIRHFKLGVLGPWEFLCRAGSCIFCVCDSAMWSAGPVQVYSGILLERMAGLYRFFCLSSSVVAGTVRLK